MDTGRLMAGAGVGDLATNNNHPWFTDKTQSPEKQAAYLDKLRRLRDDLIRKESHILTDVLERVRFQANLKSQVQSNMLRRNNPESVQPDNPAVHKQLQEERVRAIEDRRKGRKKPDLNQIEGKQLVRSSRNNPSPDIDHVEANTVSNHRTIGDYLIEKQKSRLMPRNHSAENSSKVSSRGDQSPRNARNSLPPISDHGIPPKSGTFIRQMAMHKKNPNLPGVFQSTKNRTLGRYGRKTSSHTFDLTPSVQGYETDSHRNSTGSETFEHYIDSLIRYAQRERNKKAKVYKGKQGQRPAPVKAFATGSLSSSLSQGDFLNIVEMENMPRFNGSTGDSDAISAPPATPVGRDGTSSSTEQKHSQKDNCVLCTNPEVDMGNLVLTGTHVQRKEHKVLPQILPKKVNNETENSKSDQEEKEEIRTVSVADTPPPSNHLVVNMPDINLLPPTPTPPTPTGDEDDHENNSLQKTVSQNKLRKREVKNLLEDIRELNSLVNQTSSEEDQTFL